MALLVVLTLVVIFLAVKWVFVMFRNSKKGKK